MGAGPVNVRVASLGRAVTRPSGFAAWVVGCARLVGHGPAQRAKADHRKPCPSGDQVVENEPMDTVQRLGTGTVVGGHYCSSAAGARSLPDSGQFGLVHTQASS